MADAERPVEELVTYEVTDSIARITINAPDQGNSLSWDMRDRIGDLLDEASASLAVRAVILTGAGDRHFCTGANLGGPKRAEPERPEGAPERSMGDAARLIKRGWQRLISCVLDCEKPVIGAINGTAAGGGAQLAIACDFVLMADNARFIEVFVRRGIMPDAGGAYLLPRLVGLHKAKELLMLGDDVPAEEAARIGIAMKVVPQSELQAEARALAARLAAGPTKALTMTKWLVNRSFESSRQTAFEEEAYAQELVNTSADAAEGLAAFAQRRSPEFKGW
ncbi:MAG: enoyl-CoA hydratase/isomerase family protein [Acidimicrobiales bacterium]|nr:enoyl-CoA hydratase/isomerase family protein [Acidimicrobiales bacterium]